MSLESCINLPVWGDKTLLAYGKQDFYELLPVDDPRLHHKMIFLDSFLRNRKGEKLLTSLLSHATLPIVVKSLMGKMKI